MKAKKTLILILLAAVISMLLYGCTDSDGKDNDLDVYKVTLIYGEGESKVKFVTSDEIETIFAIRNDEDWFPSKSRFKFGGWFYDEIYENAFYYDKLENGYDFTLYACWLTFNATFVYSKASNVEFIDILTVDSSPEPERTDLNFLGWMLDGSSNIITFPYDLNQDSTFYQCYDYNNAYTLDVINYSIDTESLLTGGGRYYYLNDNVTVTTSFDNEDYGFAGWFEGESTATLLSKEQSYTFKMPEKDYLIMAYWAKYCIITVIFEYPDGSSTKIIIKALKDEKIDISVPEDEKDKFDGYKSTEIKWYIDDFPSPLNFGMSWNEYTVYGDTCFTIKVI